MSTHPRHRLDEVIHAPVRFSIMATLAAADKAESASSATLWKSVTRYSPGRCPPWRRPAT
jgi:heme A synthase